MSAKNKTQATDKNIEGKILEGLGDLRGDRRINGEDKQNPKDLKVTHPDEANRKILTS